VEFTGGFSKIGRTHSPRSRIRDIVKPRIQRGGAVVSRVYLSPECKNEFSIERAIHDAFKDRRIYGELFHARADEIKKRLTGIMKSNQCQNERTQKKETVSSPLGDALLKKALIFPFFLQRLQSTDPERPLSSAVIIGALRVMDMMSLAIGLSGSLLGAADICWDFMTKKRSEWTEQQKESVQFWVDNINREQALKECDVLVPKLLGGNQNQDGRAVYAIQELQSRVISF